jgi:hypothetical protein
MHVVPCIRTAVRTLSALCDTSGMCWVCYIMYVCCDARGVLCCIQCCCECWFECCAVTELQIWRYVKHGGSGVLHGDSGLLFIMTAVS